MECDHRRPVPWISGVHREHPSGILSLKAHSLYCVEEKRPLLSVFSRRGGWKLQDEVMIPCLELRPTLLNSRDQIRVIMQRRYARNGGAIGRVHSGEEVGERYRQLHQKKEQLVEWRPCSGVMDHREIHVVLKVSHGPSRDTSWIKSFRGDMDGSPHPQ